MTGDRSSDPEAHSAKPSVSVDAVYAALAARRTQFDNLLWQVPVLSLTAQAFLFTIALSDGGTKYSRSVACLLSMVTSFLTVQIFTRHRQAEITDAQWLAEFEASSSDGIDIVHGTTWQARRNRQPADAGAFEPLRYLPGFRTWAWGLSTFGVAAFLTLVITWAAPHWLR
ncbi:hypothetical protein QWY28_14015 [Nocardioides sp. SOB77]|uniref:Uncharacterized protein n=1 Tax=Nocardioides oceani TaxID=3058369 RepID=A0ABT8FHB8_9ACTN|nr:hypothetical protein [Nocardioides oceani]MDN4174073.1 hypothetical protein [Nocardioides oceani]